MLTLVDIRAVGNPLQSDLVAGENSTPFPISHSHSLSLFQIPNSEFSLPYPHLKQSYPKLTFFTWIDRMKVGLVGSSMTGVKVRSPHRTLPTLIISPPAPKAPESKRCPSHHQAAFSLGSFVQIIIIAPLPLSLTKLMKNATPSSFSARYKYSSA